MNFKGCLQFACCRIVLEEILQHWDYMITIEPTNITQDADVINSYKLENVTVNKRVIRTKVS
jgi:hypothetical protein